MRILGLETREGSHCVLFQLFKSHDTIDGEGGGAYSVVARLSRLTIGHCGWGGGGEAEDENCRPKQRGL